MKNTIFGHFSELSAPRVALTRGPERFLNGKMGTFRIPKGVRKCGQKGVTFRQKVVISRNRSKSGKGPHPEVYHGYPARAIPWSLPHYRVPPSPCPDPVPATRDMPRGPKALPAHPVRKRCHSRFPLSIPKTRKIMKKSINSHFRVLRKRGPGGDSQGEYATLGADNSNFRENG